VQYAAMTTIVKQMESMNGKALTVAL